jgi:hypothetical protein
MGSGKTEQVIKLVNPVADDDRRVCVACFCCWFLAQQQVTWLGVDCYLDLNDKEIRELGLLTICVNLLWKLGPQSYMTMSSWMSVDLSGNTFLVQFVSASWARCMTGSSN